MRIKANLGFTLIEILITIAIISIVFGVVVTSTIQLQKSGRDAKRKSDLRTIQSALQQYFTDNFNYPMTSAFILSSATSFSSNFKTYLNLVPKDPRNTTPYFYKALNSSNSDCDNSIDTNQCVKYCLYAYLEFLNTDIAGNCSTTQQVPGASFNYNYAITLP